MESAICARVTVPSRRRNADFVRVPLPMLPWMTTYHFCPVTTNFDVSSSWLNGLLEDDAGAVGARMMPALLVHLLGVRHQVAPLSDAVAVGAHVVASDD